jgi:hypothetical protein
MTSGYDSRNTPGKGGRPGKIDGAGSMISTPVAARPLCYTLRKDDPEMTASDVIEIIQLFNQNHLDFYI